LDFVFSFTCYFLEILFFLYVPSRPPRSTLFPYTTLFRSSQPLSVASPSPLRRLDSRGGCALHGLVQEFMFTREIGLGVEHELLQDRKSTRLNSSHVKISYAVFCLKKKIKQTNSQ